MPSQPPQNVRIQPIEPRQTHLLRHTVLRQHQKLEDMVYDGDDLPTTMHIGAFDTYTSADEPIGVVTLNPAPMPGDPSETDWRLRGMAVAHAWHGKGVGALIVNTSMDKVRDQAGQRIWCNARVSAMGFYTRLGFERHGEPFDIVDIGPHYVMSVAVDQ